MKKIVLFLTLILIIPSNSFSQKFGLSVGSGLSYAGDIGGRAHLIVSECSGFGYVGVTFVGAIGQYFGGIPLGGGWVEDDSKYPKLKGIGYNIGVQLYPISNIYMGFEYFDAGTEINVKGFNLVLIGGNHRIGDHMFVDWGINMGYTSINSKFGGIIGGSIGIGYQF